MFACCLYACSNEELPPPVEISQGEIFHVLGENATTLNIPLEADILKEDWQVVSNADWCVVTKSVDNQSINVVLKANDKNEKRQAVLTITTSGKIYEIVITQQGKGGSVSDIEGDILIQPFGGKASEAQPGSGIEKTWDGDTGSSTHYHSRWGAGTVFPVILEYFFEGDNTMDYLVYHSRNGNGNFGEFDLYVATQSEPEYKHYGAYDFKMQGASSRIVFEEPLKNVTKIRFEVHTGQGDGTGYSYVSCSEMQFFARNTSENENILAVFTDLSCSELREGVTDQAIDALPPYLAKIALAIRDGKYSEYEKEFRIQEYKPYSNTVEWAERLMTKKYTILDNPTGITVKEGDEIVLLVGDTYGHSISVQNVGESGEEGKKQTEAMGDSYFLQSGINKIKINKTGMLFIIYQTDLSSPHAKPIRVHIPLDCGKVAGYWDLERHQTNEKYKEFINKSDYKYFCVRGKRMIFYFHRNEMKAAVPEDINSAINLWDDMVGYQHELMGLEGIYPEQMNNHVFAISPESGYMWQADYRIGFVYTYLNNILLKENVLAYEDNAWGPAHEIGHIHQRTINWTGCSESSNNLFSNYTHYRLGKYPSRGSTLDVLAANRFEKGQGWWNMGNVSYNEDRDCYQGEDTNTHMRMYWQLFCYYHHCGYKSDFWPEMFKALRETRIDGSNPGAAQMLFAKTACQVANEDLTDFFDMWGFFVPVDNKRLDDYGIQNYNVTQAMIDETKAYMASFPKKAAAFQYLEDRKKGEKGYNGNPGDVGYYTQFKDNQKITKNITHTRNGQTINVQNGDEAVAFELWKNGALIYFSNKFNFIVPSKIVLDDSVVVKAVQADGERFDVK